MTDLERERVGIRVLVAPSRWSRDWWALVETKDKMRGWWAKHRDPYEAVAMARRMAKADGQE